VVRAHRSHRPPMSAEAHAEYTAKASVEVQKALALAVQEAAKKLSNCLLEMRLMQETLMHKVQDFLSRDGGVAAIDASSLALLQDAATFFQINDSLLTGAPLVQVVEGCTRTLEECDKLIANMEKRATARKDFDHYRAKVGSLETQKAAQDKLQRNHKKYDVATEGLNALVKECEQQTTSFMAKRSVFTRATLHKFLRSYAAILGAVGTEAAAVAGKYAEELRPGKNALVSGLQRSKEMNGTVVTIETQADHNTADLYVVCTRSGDRKSVREEHLRPATEEDVQRRVKEEDFKTAESVSPSSADFDSGREGMPTPTGLQLRPSAAPRLGGIEVEVDCPDLLGGVSEVVIGGVKAEILEVSGRTAKVRVQPSTDIGAKDVEVRAHGYERYVSSAKAAFHFYDAIHFGKCGRNIELSDGPQGAKIIAQRKEGLLHGIVLTQSALEPLPPEAATSSSSKSSCSGPQYYYEIDVREPHLPSTRSRTILLGFAWARNPASATAEPDFGILPEVSSEMPRTLVVGGDLPKVFLDGKEVAKVPGWRPVKDVVPGTMLGLQLAPVGNHVWQLSIFQDADLRCTINVTLPESWTEAPPHALIDVCGAVKCVKLRQNALPPLPPDDESSSEEGQESEEQEVVAGA